MSKTVKRAMRVMIVGLVAMLGANAEAHYIYVFGKYKYCSICVDADFHDEGVNQSNHTDVAEFVVTIPTSGGQILCSNGANPPGLSINKNSGEVILRVRKPIVQDKSTEATLPGGSFPFTTTNVEAVVSDAAFNRLDGVCTNLIKVDRLIREMSVKINTYVCQNNGTCPSIPFDTFNVKCTLSNAFDLLNNYPLNLPPPGTPYNCGLKP